MRASIHLALEILLAALARALANGGHPAEADLQALSTALFPLIKQRAQHVMKGKARGLNLSEPDDLASAGVEKLFFSATPVILTFHGRSEGELVNFVTTVLKRLLIDDQRKLTGRKPSGKKSASANDQHDHEVASTQADNPDDQEPLEPRPEAEMAKLPKVDLYVPRVFVDAVDEEGNESLVSDRRSATGYLLLKQTKKYLHDYLAMMPGSIVMVPYGQRGKTPATKKVTLTQNHAVLLRVWMSGDGEERWKQIAEQMNKPVGTVKRWWSEAVLAFESDTSAEARVLRELYRIKPEHTRKASDTLDTEDAAVAG
jgi:DNA-directed RNA polymerase specialized sigma24 family protein